MDAKELRIGNYVQHNEKWCYRDFPDYLPNNIFRWEESDWYALGECTLSLDDIEPIPLTEEWLVKAGFEKHFYSGEYYEYNIKTFTVLQSSEYTESISFQYATWYDDSGDPKSLITIQYVHQLQNLYFALTGQELPIK